MSGLRGWFRRVSTPLRTCPNRGCEPKSSSPAKTPRVTSGPMGPMGFTWPRLASAPQLGLRVLRQVCDHPLPRLRHGPIVTRWWWLVGFFLIASRLHRGFMSCLSCSVVCDLRSAICGLWFYSCVVGVPREFGCQYRPVWPSRIVDGPGWCPPHCRRPL